MRILYQLTSPMDKTVGLREAARPLQAEFGEQRANALVARHAAMFIVASAGERIQARGREHGVGVCLAKGDALDYSVRAQSQDTCEIDVTGCRYRPVLQGAGWA